MPLTPEQREALELHEQGWGYRRIGLVLGISWSTARDRVRRAEDKLRRERDEQTAGTTPAP